MTSNNICEITFLSIHARLLLYFMVFVEFVVKFPSETLVIKVLRDGVVALT